MAGTISDESLRMLAKSAASAHTGYMQKKSTGLVPRWQRRFFKIVGEQLHFFNDEDDTARARPASLAFDLASLASVVADGTDMRLEGSAGQAALDLKTESHHATTQWQKTLGAFLPTSQPQGTAVRDLSILTTAGHGPSMTASPRGKWAPELLAEWA